MLRFARYYQWEMYGSVTGSMKGSRPLRYTAGSYNRLKAAFKLNRKGPQTSSFRKVGGLSE